MQIESARARSMNDTRNRILDVALEVLGHNPDAAMGDIASAAGVVRRTVYGHFPTRADLVRNLTQRAVNEMTAVLAEVKASDEAADAAWADFIARLWPLVRRYRVLLALRRGEYGEEIHALLGPFDTALADLVQRGQDSQAFGRHLPAGILSQIAYAAVFSIADNDLSSENFGARAATVTSLLVLGVPEAAASALVGDRA
ncbi:TetR/AcrR family transcriptional regulator [Pengzhenrongella sicca]|uniref:TetR/AcrR family transcriptional regulator n=1 Tax=Pengzhenrongella sicca TaxID=2819238 RepID=A0A8A4ZIZ3_9MICO|nr:TetR/AcrR family transcriptional regulator [Pengzhenrongella sicca]QTE30466.1 TetR/AcrR family transcriptional regulator [Pengzhenrongella sicca]